LQYSDRAYVLDAGTITLSGSAQSLLNDVRVKQAYLG
jgi:branched-chain amino acid transport system ATP-binding protein